MMNTKRIFLYCNIFLVFLLQNALAQGRVMLGISVDTANQASLQRGAKLFMNYCSGCHSLKYLRYNRMAQDLGLIDKNGTIDTQLINNLMFTQARVYDPIQSSMPSEDAKRWFGIAPPDLSLSAREHGTAWLYRYLKSFYSDNSRPFGVNNVLVPDTAMPNALESWDELFLNVPHAPSSFTQQHAVLSEKKEALLRDLVAFLAYAAEPAQLVRYRLGVYVMLFLGCFFCVAYLLNRLYWKRLDHDRKDFVIK